ncbi:SMAD/FHA domain-containing protein [Amniculicola lignicola CBS 123094]|uniref:SMAD/FHA domain-containing protein n=1 Tax=Amniculicola lignicola CBS 123094 TaxID=1392246 RepID=A0A6A5X1U5_9PLEO|nr:SMAD/FHA domain-containing protein [Amniculicola lignicola CBS 123094]
MPPSPIPSVQVTFISLDDHDDIPERVIVFGPNSEPVPVGRSSKNANKGLGASASNAFIDSPVVSRNHALITANATGTVSNVFVKDTGSMHGTLVNEVELERNLEHRLHSGDTLQFGVDVERGQGTYSRFQAACGREANPAPDTFVAKKFRVEHRLARPVSIAPPFSRGFSVPELESEEDENIEDDHSMLMTSARHPRYGSQAHPVNVDDFDDLPAEELEGRFFESPPVAIAKSRSETAQTGKSSPYASPVPVAAGIFSTIIGESQHFLVADGNDAQDSDDEEAMMDLQDDTTSVHSSEADAGNSDDAASLSGDESIHDSDADSSDDSARAEACEPSPGVASTRPGLASNDNSPQVQHLQPCHSLQEPRTCRLWGRPAHCLFLVLHWLLASSSCCP